MKFEAKIQKTIVIQGGKNKGKEKVKLTIWLIDADTKEEAIQKAAKFVEYNPNFGELLNVQEALQENEIKLVPDSENLLFELDANKADEITVAGGLDKKGTTYTRKQIEASVYAEISEVTHAFNSWNGTHQRRVID